MYSLYSKSKKKKKNNKRKKSISTFRGTSKTGILDVPRS